MQPPPRVQAINWVVNAVVALFLALVSQLLYVLKLFRTSAPLEQEQLGAEPPVEQSKDKVIALEKAIPGNCFIRVNRRVYLALFDAERASVMALHQLKQNFLVVPLIPKTSRPATGGSPTSFSLASLTEIFKFDVETRALYRQNPGRKLVFCTGADDPLVSSLPPFSPRFSSISAFSRPPQVQVRAALLLGCHCLMTLNMDYERFAIAAAAAAPVSRQPSAASTAHRAPRLEAGVDAPIVSPAHPSYWSLLQQRVRGV